VSKVADEQSSWLQHLKHTAKGQAESLGAQSIFLMHADGVRPKFAVEQPALGEHLLLLFWGFALILGEFLLIFRPLNWGIYME